MGDSFHPTSRNRAFHIGWDVGGWNCDKNARSRDAIVILDDQLRICGNPWRGNLRVSINEAKTSKEWVTSLFDLCDYSPPEGMDSVVIAIDTPLGFSTEFRDLVNECKALPEIGDSADNRYLYRHTERELLGLGWKPMSPLKDMIGSQATKGLHVLAKFATLIESCGVWTDGNGFRAIESYPTVCRKAPPILELRKRYRPMPDPDIEDALVCALLASLFSSNRDLLLSPGKDVPESEGWIWVPRFER